MARWRVSDNHSLVQRGISGGERKAFEAELLGLFIRDAAPSAPGGLVRVFGRDLAPHALGRLKVGQGVLEGGEHVAHACRTDRSVVSQCFTADSSSQGHQLGTRLHTPMAAHALMKSCPVTDLRLAASAWSLASDMRKQMNSVAASCINDLASWEIFAYPRWDSSRAMIFAMIAIGMKRSCDARVRCG